MEPDKNKVAAFAVAAGNYCALIEGMGKVRSSAETLDLMSDALGDIHRKVMELGAQEPQRTPDYEHGNFDARFELFLRLKGRMGELDRYPMEFSESDSEDGPLGSLADDFTDIYFDLKDGLAALQQNPDDLQTPVKGWLETFRLHWGQHLFDAVFALNARQNA